MEGRPAGEMVRLQSNKTSSLLDMREWGERRSQGRLSVSTWGNWMDGEELGRGRAEASCTGHWLCCGFWFLNRPWFELPLHYNSACFLNCKMETTDLFVCIWIERSVWDPLGAIVLSIITTQKGFREEADDKWMKQSGKASGNELWLGQRGKTALWQTIWSQEEARHGWAVCHVLLSRWVIGRGRSGCPGRSGLDCGSKMTSLSVGSLYLPEAF